MRGYAEVEDDLRDYAESVGVRDMTGILLAIARIAGETAPLLLPRSPTSSGART